MCVCVCVCVSGLHALGGGVEGVEGGRKTFIASRPCGVCFPRDGEGRGVFPSGWGGEGCVPLPCEIHYALMTARLQYLPL